MNSGARPSLRARRESDLVERQRGACGKRNFASFCCVDQRVGWFSLARQGILQGAIPDVRLELSTAARQAGPVMRDSLLLSSENAEALREEAMIGSIAGGTLLGVYLAQGGKT
jgi:hypothetical protein